MGFAGVGFQIKINRPKFYAGEMITTANSDRGLAKLPCLELAVNHDTVISISSFTNKHTKVLHKIPASRYKLQFIQCKKYFYSGHLTQNMTVYNMSRARDT